MKLKKGCEQMESILRGSFFLLHHFQQEKNDCSSLSVFRCFKPSETVFDDPWNHEILSDKNPRNVNEMSAKCFEKTDLRCEFRSSDICFMHNMYNNVCACDNNWTWVFKTVFLSLFLKIMRGFFSRIFFCKRGKTYYCAFAIHFHTI